MNARQRRKHRRVRDRGLSRRFPGGFTRQQVELVRRRGPSFSCSWSQPVVGEPIMVRVCDMYRVPGYNP